MVGFVVCAVEGLGDTDETLQVPAQHASHRFFSASLFSTFSFLNEFLSFLGGKSFIGISDAKVQEEEKPVCASRNYAPIPIERLDDPRRSIGIGA